jgi:hypothetical protein
VMTPDEELEARSGVDDPDGSEVICRNCGVDAFDHLFEGCSNFQPIEASDILEDQNGESI